MTLTDTIQNSALAALAHKAPRNVVSAIKGASEKIGVDFAYLLQQAKAESSFQPDIKAKTSSASGLFQFIESTWMDMVNKYGDKHGIDTQGKSKDEILAMRFDEEKSSVMAAEFASENKRILTRKWGGNVGATELYFAHFLGAGQASAFLNARDENPLQAAATLFPRAAKANHNVFYEPATGRARSLDEVYAFFDRKFQIKGDSNAPQTMIAEAATPDNTLAPPTASSMGSLYRDNSPIFAPRQAMSYWVNSYSPAPYQSLVHAPVDIMILADLEMPLLDKNSDSDKKS